MLSRNVYGPIDFNSYIENLDNIANKVRKLAKNSDSPEMKIWALNKVIFNIYGFKYDHEKLRHKDNYFLVTVMDRKLGNCMGLPLIYACVAERLNWPIYIVNAPWHSFCRWDDGEYIRNIEVTTGGSHNPDIVYIDDFLITKNAYKKSDYLKTIKDTTKQIAHLGHTAGSYFMFQHPPMAYEYLKYALDVNPNSINLNLQLFYFYKQLSHYTTNPFKISNYHNKMTLYWEKSINLGANYTSIEKYEKAFNEHKKNKPKIETKEDAIRYVKKIKEKYHDYFN